MGPRKRATHAKVTKHRDHRGHAKTSDIAKYGKDEVDEVLKLDDEPFSEAGSISGGEDEEDVMVADEDDEDVNKQEDTRGSFKAALRRAHAPPGEGEDEEWSAVKEAIKSGTAGWQREDFYGGDDAGGDSSDGGSDEELHFQEAKRLEELRAQRLYGAVARDALAVLLGDSEAADPGADTADAASAASATAGPAARFDSIFAVDAERSAVSRDVRQLSESGRKSLVKREAPELIPLLSDFKSKLAALQELLPLLSLKAQNRLPESGASYLESKAALLLNTLANLSFYVLLRAEGGAVRTHPVVSQLVWLKDLHEKVAPLDTRLRGSLRRLLKNTQKAKAVVAPALDETSETAPAPAAVPASERRLGLRERLDRLVRHRPLQPLPLVAGATPAPEPHVDDLLRLPARRLRERAADGAPADLDEADPTVGIWMPKSTVLGEHLTSVNQYVSDYTARTRPTSADLNVEARPRRVRERLQESPANGAAATERKDPGLADGVGRESDGEARAEAKANKASGTSRARGRSSQATPEVETEGRRKTSKKILENRGLMRVRKKEAGNARVSNRKKYEKRVKKRRGAVQDMREGAADGATYEGEASGLRTHVKKSMKLS